MSFFKRKAKNKEPERVPDAKATRAPLSPQSPSQATRNHNAFPEASGLSKVAFSAISANMDSFASGRTAILKKQPSHMEAAHFGDLGHSSVNYQPQETRSRLSKSADQVLQDNVALPHFMHYMEQRGADHLVRFWLEAESFRSASWSRVRAHSLNSVKHSSLAEPVPVSPEGSDPQTLVQSTPSDPNISREGPAVTSERREPSSTEAGLRPSTPRADTPNRQATSRAGTPCKGQSSSTLRDLSDKLMKTIEKDAVTIFTKYISPDAAKPIPITEQIRNDIVAKICGEDGMVDPNCFVIAQSVVLSILEQQHFSGFLWSHHFCKYQIEVLTSGSVFLADILFSESALFYFSEYMEKEEAMNILQFWLAADNFQNQLAAKKGQYDGQEAQNDAMILYDKYFSLQATNPLGFGDSVRMEIESNICREGGPLPDCFTTPLRQAWTTMEKQGAKKAAVKILKNFDEAITVDVASLDPESLYQRPYAGKMTFGKVNELGQFIREAEPEPDVKKSKAFVFAMKAQEEMAWQIAKMIVNDVVHQSNHSSPGKATKVPKLHLVLVRKCLIEVLSLSPSVCSYDPIEAQADSPSQRTLRFTRLLVYTAVSCITPKRTRRFTTSLTIERMFVCVCVAVGVGE
uniref:A kinase (PRKA) anchor protein 10 n=1 Tax=Oryzias sinensis TaxID=183150 RepID=A0A8C8DNF6_9TELE